jgi:hypothetical protein
MGCKPDPRLFSGPSVLIKKSYLNNNIEPTPTLCCKVAWQNWGPTLSCNFVKKVNVFESYLS